MLKNRKGQEPLTVVLMAGILIVVISSVYLWGAPLIEKNKDVASLRSAEGFMTNLNKKILDVAKDGGREQVIIESGIVRFDPGVIRLYMETSGTYYTENIWIPLTAGNCTLDGVWGVDPYESLCVRSENLGSNYKLTYELRYRLLNTSARLYQISLDGQVASGGEGNTILIENTGSTAEPAAGGTLIKTHITIKII